MEKITLYSRDSKSNILEWSVRIAPTPSNKTKTGQENDIVVEEGLLEGKKTETRTTISKGKNIGKMNESSSREQAKSQALSKIEKKKKQGYKSLEDLGMGKEIQVLSNQEYSIDYLKGILNHALPANRTDAEGYSKPMKAQPYYKVKTVNGIKFKTNEPVIKFPCLGQPKLNGFRVICRWEKVKLEQGTVFEQEIYKPVFRSKEGLRYDILEHIESELTEQMFKWNINGKEIELAFDGEMYIHGEILSEISSAVRKRNLKTTLLKFYIFDLAIEDLRQDERLRILEEISRISTQNNTVNLGWVIHTEINSNEQAQMFTDMHIKAGHEGAIFRDKKATYQFGKRPQTMTKLKRSEDKEFPIIDVVGGDNTPELGVFVCRAENGESFKVTPEGTQDSKREYLSNKSNYIGKMLTVRFFERTTNGLPFHGIGVVRDYE
jgi:hypothetical protein